MNFMEAVKTMKEGKEVTRENWDRNVYSILADDIKVMHGQEIFREQLNCVDCQATDWEIYKEEDNWNLAECDVYITPTKLENWRSIDDIKKFIQKVKEDIGEIVKEINIVAIDNKQKEIYEVALNDLKKIIDKRAGDL